MNDSNTIQLLILSFNQFHKQRMIPLFPQECKHCDFTVITINYLNLYNDIDESMKSSILWTIGKFFPPKGHIHLVDIHVTDGDTLLTYMTKQFIPPKEHYNSDEDENTPPPEKYAHIDLALQQVPVRMRMRDVMDELLDEQEWGRLETAIETPDLDAKDEMGPPGFCNAIRFAKYFE